MADQAIVSALDVLNRGQIPRRPRPHPADSIALVDACSLLAPADVMRALGRDVAGEPTFANWECNWLFGPKEVHVAFDRDDWPLASESRRQIEVGERAAYVQEGTSGWPDACQAEIAYRRFGPDRQWVETVELYVERAGRDHTGGELRGGRGHGPIHQRPIGLVLLATSKSMFTLEESCDTAARSLHMAVTSS